MDSKKPPLPHFKRIIPLLRRLHFLCTWQREDLDANDVMIYVFKVALSLKLVAPLVVPHQH